MQIPSPGIRFIQCSITLVNFIRLKRDKRPDQIVQESSTTLKDPVLE